MSFMKKGLKKDRGRSARLAATVTLLLLSAAALGAKYYFSVQREKQNSQMTVPPEAVILRENFSETLANGLTAGANLLNDPCVTVRRGSAYVRFNVELSDSDGVPIGEKLAEKKQEIDDYRALDSDSQDSTVLGDMMNEYNRLYTKGLLAFQSLCRDMGYGEEDQESIGDGGAYTAEELEQLQSDGKISYLVDEDTELDGDGDFVQLYDEDNPFSRQFVYKKAVSEGESCTLFTNIIVPSDWDGEQTRLMVYTTDDDGENLTGELQGVENMVLIGDGFKLSVSAEVVDTSGFKNPIAAFETAESTSAVTELSSDSSEN